MINKQRLGETFQELVAIDSVSKTESRMSAKIREMLEPLGGRVFIDDAGNKTGSDTGNLIIKFAGTRQAPPLLLNAHMDTVEPGIGVKPQFSDGIFQSDGTTVLGADDKSAVAILIETMRVIHENNLAHGPLELVFTICEEIGLLGAKFLDNTLISAKFGYSLDTSDTETIITQAPAANRFDLRVHGKAAHAGAEPEKGINAICVASQAIAKLELGRIDADTTANIGSIQCDGATNIVPEQVQVRGEIRSHSPDTLERISAGIVDAFEAAARDFPQQDRENNLPRIAVNMENEFPATHIPENHPVIVHARAAAERLGRRLTAKRTGGGSDANIFFARGIVTGVIGTGMREVHTVREWIRLADMVQTTELLLAIIDLHACGGQG